MKVFGHIVCPCGTPELDVVGWKTGGLCAGCFRAKANRIFDEVTVHTADREPLRIRVHPTKRSLSDRNHRRRRRKTARDRAQAKAAAQAQSKALRRLRDLFPEIFEVLLADERAKAGLNAWTLERALTPHDTSSSLETVLQYHHLEAS